GHFFFFFFFFQAEDGIRDRNVTGVQTCALPIFQWTRHLGEIVLLLSPDYRSIGLGSLLANELFSIARELGLRKIVARMASEQQGDRKSTRLNSSHVSISYAVFCLKKKNDQ